MLDRKLLESLGAGKAISSNAWNGLRALGARCRSIEADRQGDAVRAVRRTMPPGP